MAVSRLPRASEPREARQGDGGRGLRDLGRGERPQLPRGHRGRLREAGVQVRVTNNAKTNAIIFIYSIFSQGRERGGGRGRALYLHCDSLSQVSFR